MSYVAPTVGESFVFRVRKTVGSQPDVHWFNTYEARFQSDGTQANLDSLAAGLVEFEKSLLLNSFVIDQVTISTWSEDAHPYNPNSFVTTPFNEIGARVGAFATVADLRVALFIKRQCISGRIGRIFLRGSLLLDDLVTSGGVFALADAPAFVTALSTAVDAGSLESNMFGGSSDPTLSLIGENQLTREITAFALGGVSMIKLNHKYFDRP